MDTVTIFWELNSILEKKQIFQTGGKIQKHSKIKYNFIIIITYL